MKEPQDKQESKNPILEKISNYAGVMSGTASAVVGVATGDPMATMSGAVTFFSNFITPFMQKNRDKFFNDLKKDLEKLEKDFDRKISNVLNNEKVLSAILEAYPIALKEYQEEKRELLRNAILNIAMDIDVKEDIRSIYLRYIDELSPSHIKILQYFRNPKEFLVKNNIDSESIYSISSRNLLGIFLPSMEEHLDQFVTDLISRGLLPRGEWVHAGTMDFMDPHITDRGHDFLKFVESPLK